MNVLLAVWKRCFLKITQHRKKLPVSAVKFINNISPPSMATVKLSLDCKIAESSDRLCIFKIYISIDVIHAKKALNGGENSVDR